MYGELGWELYDLQADPEELRDLYDRSAHADVVADVKAELDRLRRQRGDMPSGDNK